MSIYTKIPKNKQKNQGYRKYDTQNVRDIVRLAKRAYKRGLEMIKCL